MKLKCIGQYLALFTTWSNQDERSFASSLKGRWNKKLKCWTFSPSIVAYKSIIEDADQREMQLEIDPKIKTYFEEKINKNLDYKVTSDFKTKSYNYQLTSTEFLLSLKKAFLFTDPGSGKSKISIDSVAELYAAGKVKKVLVISPESIIPNFANQIEEHSHMDSTKIVGSLDVRKNLLRDSTTVFDIINYEMLGKLEKEIKANNYDMVIIDEIHYCKNHTSQRSKNTYKVTRNIPIRVGLTATAICNNHLDVFMPFKIIDESIFGPFITHFKQRYIIYGYMGYDIDHYVNEEELKQLIASISMKYSIRDVKDDLPEETNIYKEVHLKPKTMATYKALKTQMITEVEAGEVVVGNALTKILRLAQVASGFVKPFEEDICDLSDEKLEVLEDFLGSIESKCAIYCRFLHSMDRIEAMLKRLKIKYCRFDGATKDKELYFKFEKGDARVWLCQSQKSEGYSIPSAQYVIFYELTYSHKDHVQIRGRILRALKTQPYKNIFYVYLLAKDTIDEVCYKALEMKHWTAEDALSYVKGVST